MADPVSPQVVNLTAPDGSLVQADANNEKVLREGGYRPTTPEEEAALAQQKEYEGQGIRAGLEGIGRGATMGLSDVVQAEGAGLGTRLGNALADKVFGETEGVDRSEEAAAAVKQAKADLLGRKEANAGMAAGGELLGGLGLGIATGGLGTAGLAGKGATTLAKAGYSALAGAAEGAAYGAAKAANDDFLADHEITAERIFLGAKDGALLGGALGAGASLIGSGAKYVGGKAREAVGNMLGEGGVGGYLDDLAGESAYKAAVGRTSKQAIKLADRQGGSAAVGKTLLDEGIDLTADAETILQQTAQKADEVGAKLGSMVKEADSFGTGGPSKRGLKEAIEENVLKKLDDGTFSESTAATVRGKMRKLFDILSPSEVTVRSKTGAKRVIEQEGLNPLEANLAGKLTPGDVSTSRALNRDSLTFEELRNFRRELDTELANWNNVGAEKGPLQAYRDIRRTMEDYWLNSAEEAAQKAGRTGFAQEMKDLKKTYSHLSLARDQAQEAVQTQLANRATSLTDTIAGAGAASTAGGPLGLLAGVATSQAHRFVRERGRGMLATAIYRARQAATNGEMALDDAAGGLLSAVRRSATAARQAATRTSASIPIAGVVLNARDPKSYERAIQRLTDLQNQASPDRQQLTQRHDDLAGESPEHAAALDQQTQRTVDFLLAKAGPTALNLGDPFGYLRPPRHDRESALALGRYAKAAQDPYAALERISKGVQTREDVETLRTLYPKTWQRFADKVKANLQSLKKIPDYKTRVKLSQVLGEPMTAFETPSFQASIAATNGMAAAAEQQAKQPSLAALQKSGLGDSAGSDAVLARGAL